MLKIAIQNKGRLSDGSVNFLKSLGLKFDSPGRSLIVQCENLDVSILYMRTDDIVDCVESGIADFGIVGSYASFADGSVNNITLLTADEFSDAPGYWGFKNIGIDQIFSAGQDVGTYTFDLTISVI